MTEQKLVSLPIVGSHICNHCTACGRSTGPTVSLHNHHVIPRAFGGTDGPQITLCVDHHEFVHDLAKQRKIVSIGSFPNLTESPKCVKILVYLINVIVRSELSTKKDPNRPIRFSCQVPQATMTKLNTIMRVRGIKNHTQFLTNIIDKMYTSVVK